MVHITNILVAFKVNLGLTSSKFKKHFVSYYAFSEDLKANNTALCIIKKFKKKIVLALFDLQHPMAMFLAYL